MTLKLSVLTSKSPECQKDLELANLFATEGLRVLSFGMRKVEERELLRTDNLGAT
eukprot:CAMPEP_0185599654 /NCGR_PEP_ID=MMETSP0434-20130131/82853_1 /TAXON_ID=626734 ORGANISM="Favella taraikaensis, Strain Fe Narragansett Bay" /NCGR_SAMPLE_ID=MMETSP0434 /ASSEMBLY_ACC=CAM_ASM_000379 /LENGTH=54 /DNA_ID=CAMNT_0028229131 /DNA_START=179 /DNA_END=343 /DNA_ORIENTATION=-